ncbi:hypothetical protein GGR52DRAFT_567842 [Hypoxylon sp. FL1284]|nr:hypothetical protein GGR52DRAFT_567842 [Hypoxylon sp. FL1284]
MGSEYDPRYYSQPQWEEYGNASSYGAPLPYHQAAAEYAAYYDESPSPWGINGTTQMYYDAYANSYAAAQNGQYAAHGYERQAHATGHGASQSGHSRRSHRVSKRVHRHQSDSWRESRREGQGSHRESQWLNQESLVEQFGRCRLEDRHSPERENAWRQHQSGKATPPRTPTHSVPIQDSQEESEEEEVRDVPVEVPSTPRPVTVEDEPEEEVPKRPASEGFQALLQPVEDDDQGRDPESKKRVSSGYETDEGLDKKKPRLKKRVSFKDEPTVITIPGRSSPALDPSPPVSPVRPRAPAPASNPNRQSVFPDVSEPGRFEPSRRAPQPPRPRHRRDEDEDWDSSNPWSEAEAAAEARRHRHRSQSPRRPRSSSSRPSSSRPSSSSSSHPSPANRRSFDEGLEELDRRSTTAFTRKRSDDSLRAWDGCRDGVESGEDCRRARVTVGHRHRSGSQHRHGGHGDRGDRGNKKRRMSFFGRVGSMLGKSSH